MKKVLLLIGFFTLTFSFVGLVAHAQEINIDASRLVSHTKVFFSPSSGSFVEGSSFDVPIYVDTKGRSINGVEIHLEFDSSKLSVIRPAGGTSIVGIWVEPPNYDNSRGTVNYVGVIPGGITTEAGLIGSITFQAKSPGNARVSYTSNSKILLNDGLGTESLVEYNRGEYTILPKAPEGIRIFSETHPFQAEWYNNNSPILSWDKEEGVEGFSYVLDNKPSTVPENTINSSDTTTSFENLGDGLWYFHIKAQKNGVWGNTGHFLLRIDTTPPARFKPETNYMVAAVVFVARTMVSFYTTDNLSGLDYYEVGIIDKNAPPTESPLFVRAESPYQVSLTDDSKFRVVVRAVDKAGNVRDEFVDVEVPFALYAFIKTYTVYILASIIILGFVMLLFHYLFGHHIIRNLRKAMQIVKKDDLNHTHPHE
jgi:hypothetical protein